MTKLSPFRLDDLLHVKVIESVSPLRYLWFHLTFRQESLWWGGLESWYDLLPTGTKVGGLTGSVPVSLLIIKLSPFQTEVEGEMMAQLMIVVDWAVPSGLVDWTVPSGL
jgi:hypothetical protein